MITNLHIWGHDLISEVTRLQTTKEDLLKQIHRAEIKLKGISTMIANLHTRKEEVQKQTDLIARQFGQGGVDNADLAMQMSKLRKEMESIDEKLALRQKMLDDANATITEAKQRLAEMKFYAPEIEKINYLCKSKSRTEILVPIAAIQAVPIAVIAWYRYSAIIS